MKIVSSEKGNYTSFAAPLKMLVVMVYSGWMVSALMVLSAIPFHDYTLLSSGNHPVDLNLTLTFTASFLFFSFYGYFCAFFSERIFSSIRGKRFSLLLHRIFALFSLFAMLAIFIFIFSYLSENIVNLLFLLFCPIAFFCSFKQYSMSYCDILTYVWVTVNIIFPFGCIIFMYINNIEYPAYIPIAVLLIQTFVFMLTKSQGNLDFMMKRRQHRMEHLPITIRRYVFLLTVVLALLMLLVVLLWDVIVMGFMVLGGLIVDFLSFLLSLINSDVSSPLADAPAAAEQSDSPFATAENPYADIINLLTYLFLCGVIIFLSVRFRRQILGFFLAILSRIATFLSKALSSSLASNYFKKPTSEYYTDLEGYIPSSQRRTSHKKPITLREWKKLYSRFLSLDPCDKTYRLGFGLTQTWLALNGVESNPSDTPLELLKRVKDILPEQQWSGVVDCYNRIRYSPNSQPTDQETKALIECMNDFLKKQNRI